MLGCKARGLALALAMAVASADAAGAPTAFDSLPALLATCERECPRASACVVAGGEAAVRPRADCWERDHRRVELGEGAESLAGRRTLSAALATETARRWRRAQLVSVEDVDASALVPLLASFAELSALSLRNASLSAFPAQVFSLPALRRLDLRGNVFSAPVRLSGSERRFLAQLEAFATDPSAFDAQCDDPQPVGDRYVACDGGSKLPVRDAAWSSFESHVDTTQLLSASTGGADSPSSSSSSSSSSSDGKASVDTLTWVVVGSVVSLVLLILLVAYCYTKWGRRRRGGHELEDGGAEAEPSSARRFLPFQSRRRRSRLRPASRWHDDPKLRKWAVDPAALVPLRQIGAGAFSTVWLAQYMTDTVALKRFLPVAARSSASSASQRDFHDAFTSELQLLATLSHPKIVALVGVVYAPPPALSPHLGAATDDRDKLGLVLEYMERGDLRAFLSATRQTKQAGAGWSRRKLAIAADVAEAIAYLHAQSPPVLHRDVTSRNILLDANFTAKLADFGLSRRLRVAGDADDAGAKHRPSALAMSRGVGTSRWMAPEMLTGDGAYSTAVDVYSFGVVLAELDRHAPPFSDLSLSNGKPLSDRAVLELLRAGAIAPDVSDACPKPVAALMLECLSTDPAARPAASYAASRLRAMLERLRRVSDVGDDIAGEDSESLVELVEAGGLSSGLQLNTNMADSFLGVDGASASASGGGHSSDSLAASQYSLMQDSN